MQSCFLSPTGTYIKVFSKTQKMKVTLAIEIVLD